MHCNAVFESQQQTKPVLGAVDRHPSEGTQPPFLLHLGIQRSLEEFEASESTERVALTRYATGRRMMRPSTASIDVAMGNWF